MEFKKEYEKQMKCNPVNALKTFKNNGILKQYIPELDNLELCDQNPAKHPEGNVFNHIIMALSNINNQSMKIINSITFHDIGKLVTKKGTRYPNHDTKGVPIAEEILIDLDRPDDEIDCVLFCVENHMRIHDILETKPLERLKLYTNEHFDVLCQVYKADTYGRSKDCKVDKILNDMNLLLKNENNPLVNEKEILAYGIIGNEVKTVINDLMQKQATGKIKNKPEALRFIKSKYVKWNITNLTFAI